MTIFAYLALLGWIPVVLIIFARTGVRRRRP
jgi:hypothetical protein